MLTKQQELFCQNVAAGYKTAEAYKMAYPKMSDRKVADASKSLLKKTDIIRRISELEKIAAEKSQFTAVELVRNWVNIATANPAELIRYERVNCRHCHGNNYQYQWIDYVEFEAEVTRVENLNLKRGAIVAPEPLPSDAGGYGFRIDEHPRKACPRCQGEGVERVFIEDTRNLSEQGKALYAGVKTTKDGIEIKMRDQDAALNSLAKYFGILDKDNGVNVNVNITNVPDLPVPDNPLEAAKFYQNIMQGKMQVTK